MPTTKTLMELRLGQRFRLIGKKDEYIKVKHDEKEVEKALLREGLCCVVRVSKRNNLIGTCEISEETKVLVED